MISPLREHRLCHLKIEDINKQRKAAGVAPIASPVVNAKDRTYTMSAPVGTNSRSAQQNAAQQTQQYQSNLSAAQKTPYVATYIDPATGKDTRNPTTVNTPVYYGATPENPTGTGEVSHWDTNTTMDQGKLIGSDGEPYTGQQPKQSVPKTSAEYRAAPTTGPVSTVTTLPKPAFTSQDLQAAVAQRREKRLGELGVQQGDIDKVNSLLEQGYTFNNSTMDGRPIFTKNGNQSDYVVLEGFSEDKLKAVEEAKKADFTKEVTDEMAAADAAAKTARAETAKATKTAVGDTSPAAPAATPIKGPDFSMFDSQIAQVNAMVQADPNLAATYTPLLMSLAARRTQLENDFTIATTQFNNQDKDNDGVADGVEAAYSVGVEAAERRANEADRINLENRDINLAAANLAKDMAEIAQKKFELEQHRNEQLVLEQNVERERKNRLIANKLGIASGGNGLRWMAEEVRKGNDMLSYLKEAGSLQESSFALETGRNYTLNVRKATNDYASQKMQIDKQFSDDIAELKKMVNLDAKERKEERKTIVKEYMDALDKNDEKFAEQVKGFRIDMQHKVEEEKADQRQKQQDAMDRIEWLVNTYDPRSVADTIREIAKDVPGLNVESLVSNPTIELQRMKKTGGGSGGGFSALFGDMPKTEIVSYDEFVKGKIMSYEDEIQTSLSPEARDKFKEANEVLWRDEYARTMAPSFDSAPSSGSTAVDLAAKAFLDGEFGRGVTSLGKAASAAGVSQGDVLKQVQNLRSHGYKPSFPVLTTEQAKNYATLNARVSKNPLYIKAADGIGKLRTLEIGLNQKNGNGDIAAINVLQSGFIDPGATVRSEDVALLRSASALVDQLNPSFLLQRIKNGDLLPEPTREKLRTLARKVAGAYIDQYNEVALPTLRKEAGLYGLPDTVLDELTASSSIDLGQESSVEYDWDSYLSAE